MNEVKIFVVIVTFNGRKWVNRCFLSFRKSQIPINVIVVDNGSTDGTQELIQEKYPEVDFGQSAENLGFGRANNIGIKKAYENNADYVFLLNQDAWIEPDTLEKLIKVAGNNVSYGILSPMHLNGKGTALDLKFSSYLSPNNCANLISDFILSKERKEVYSTQYVNAAAWLLTRKCIEVVGGFNPLFHLYGEDDNYLQRVLYHDLKVGIVPNSIIYHDREQRFQSPHLIDSRKTLRRLLLRKYCNPNEVAKLKDEFQMRRRIMLKKVVSLKFKEVFEEWEDYRYLKSLEDDIIISKAQSAKKGFTYL
tara:strand:- start:4 stop:924 length:921 start_codon:yes stop_codon:yes gene_type:complete